MRILVFTVLITLLSVEAFAQKSASVVEAYKEIFKIEKQQYGDRTFLRISVNELEPTSLFSEFVNQNSVYVDYLRQNFTPSVNHEPLLAISDSTELQNRYIQSLEQDQTFNEVMRGWAARTNDKDNQILDTVSMDELLNVAVKYFAIIRVTEEGGYAGKVCTGINGIRQTLEERKPHLEAFCFASILKNLRGEQYHIYNEFVKGIKELYKIELGLDNEEKLFRAQGAMYLFMRNNAALKAMLLDEYDQRKQYLPFILEG